MNFINVISVKIFRAYNIVFLGGQKTCLLNQDVTTFSSGLQQKNFSLLICFYVEVVYSP